MAKDVQTPFDVAVVMFTKRTGSLATAVRSVFQQDFAGRVQVVIATDGPQADRAALVALLKEVPPTMALSIVDLGYSTARSRGGLYAPEAGGALRAALTLLANARHVAYLSEVNMVAPDHLSALKKAIGEHAWAWTQRWYADARNGSVICRDDWESAGPDAGAFAKSEGGFVAADALLIDKFACASALPAWLQADDQGRGEDRRFFQAIRALPHGATGMPTLFQSIHVQNQNPFMLAQFRERGVVLERYVTMTPELERDIAHALRAQRDYERSVKENFKYGDVEFVRAKDGGAR
jgi:hypothetical protein